MHRSHGSFELVMSPVLLALGGLGIDRILGSTPWITVIAAILGFGGAAIKIYCQYSYAMAELDEKRVEALRQRQLAGDGS